MKKHILILMTFLLGTAFLAGCSCQHQWTEATCTAPKTCSKCSAVEGTHLEHSWTEADCTTSRTCSRCALTEGEPLGHNWTEATCNVPKTCSRCKTTEGQPLEHRWIGEATLYTAPSCELCGADGEPLPGYCAQNGLAPNIQPRTAIDYHTSTYVRPDLDTSGSLLASGPIIFEYDSTHRTKAGYEWRSAEISITFSDNRSMLYSPSITWARADYYQDTELKPAKKQERFTVNYNGKDYQCLASYENISISYINNQTVFQMTCYIQVPVGYDGVVLAFYHGSIDVNGMHLHEVNDENMLLFRFA